MEIDHLVLVTADLDFGAAAVSDYLGVDLAPGGRHPAMGTRNRLLSLGSAAYLEVIAVDPEAPAPGRPRWFGLDAVTDPAPRLAHWAARVPDLDAALAAAPFDLGAPVEMARGDLAWRMAVPSAGMLPFDGAVPALLSWSGDGAAARLPASGCRLVGLALRHPRMGDIRNAWPGLAETPGVTLSVAPQPAIEARIETPRGLRTLTSLSGAA